MTSFELLTPDNTAHVGGVTHAALCPISLAIPSKEESLPVSTATGSPTKGQCQPLDVVSADSQVDSSVVGLSKTPILRVVPCG